MASLLIPAGASVTFTALGNSLEPVSALALLQPVALLAACRRLPEQRGSRLAACAALVIVHAAGWTVAFGGLLKVDSWSASGLAIIFVLGLALWAALLPGAYLTSLAFDARFPDCHLRTFAFPTATTSIYALVAASPLSSMTNPGYALTEYAPLALSASLVGIHGLNFALSLAATLLDQQMHARGGSARQRLWTGGALLALVCYGSAWGHLDTFYQRDIQRTAPQRELAVGCVLAPAQAAGAEAWMLAQTAQRLAAGDALVLWSEAALRLPDSAAEAALLARVADMQAAANASTFVGLTFLQAQANANMFVLLAPDGSVAWRYQKAHPVPFVGDGAPGRAALPVVDAPGIGRLSGAICFDMDFPGYLRQAGGRRAALLLQPSNTWGPIGAYHFADNALRAVEGGFTHVRCSSGGFSGVATPFYSFVHHAASLDHRALSFSVPLRRAVWTPYAHGGFLLEWAVAGAAVLLWGVMAMPRRLLERHLPRAAARLLWPVQSELTHEEPPAAEEGRPLL